MIIFRVVIEIFQKRFKYTPNLRSKMVTIQPFSHPPLVGFLFKLPWYFLFTHPIKKNPLCSVYGILTYMKGEKWLHSRGNGDRKIFPSHGITPDSTGYKFTGWPVIRTRTPASSKASLIHAWFVIRFALREKMGVRNDLSSFFFSIKNTWHH